MERKINAIISMCIVVLFLIHGISGGFVLFGMTDGGGPVLHVLTVIMAVLIIIHAVIGIQLTVATIRKIRRSGTMYMKGNRLFWARRISGFAVMIFLVFHLALFAVSSGGAYRLKVFDGANLIFALLLAVSLGTHVLTNIKPFAISVGASRVREYIKDILFVLSIVMIFCAAAFIIYFIRWNFL